MKTLQNLILLSRVGMLPLSLSVPIIGALSLRQYLSWIELLALAGLGICAHFFGFVLNDLMDYPLDKNSPFRQRSPLVKGEIKHRQAWLFVALQIPLAYILYHQVLSAPLSGLIWLLLSVMLSMIYNLFSKWRWLPRIFAELALALSVMALALGGAWAFQQQLPPDTLLYCATLGVIVLLVNSVPSGLKDIQFDKQFGARSFVLSTGTTVSPDGDLGLSLLLKRYMVSLQALISILLVIVATQYMTHIFAWIILLGLQLFAGLHSLRLLRLAHVDQFRHVFLLLGGFYNYFALVIVIWGYLPLLIQLAVGFVVAYLLSIPLQRAWSVYRQRNRVILRS